MKMPKDRYDRIKARIAAYVDAADPIVIDALRERVNPVRFRWGLLWRAFPGGFGFDLYADGINDDHVDTVLRRVTVELGLEG